MVLLMGGPTSDDKRETLGTAGWGLLSHDLLQHRTRPWFPELGYKSGALGCACSYYSLLAHQLTEGGGIMYQKDDGP